MGGVFGSEFRRVENRQREGKEVVAAVAIRTYDTTVDDLWDAVTTPERIKRWFLTVEGELKLGGRYQLIGNAGGTITRCEKPHALDLTWEIMGGTSWVQLRLDAVGAKARLTLEHIAPKDGIGEEHLKKYGPGAVGIGWDLTLHGLSLHLTAPAVTLDPKEAEAWSMSPEGKQFIRSSGDAWCAADALGGETADEARAKADRTIAFYTGG